MLIQAIFSYVGFNPQIEQVRVVLYGRDKVECASHEVGDDDCQQDQAEDLVHLLHDLLEDNLLWSCLAAEDGLNNRVDTGKIQQVDDSGDPDQSDKLQSDEKDLICVFALVVSLK